MSAYNPNLSKNEIRRLKSYLEYLRGQQMRCTEDMESAAETHDTAVRLEREFGSRNLFHKMYELELKLDAIDEEVANRRANGEKISEEAVKNAKQPLKEELDKYKYFMRIHDNLTHIHVTAPKFSDSLRKYRELTNQIQYFEQLLYHDLPNPTIDYTQLPIFQQYTTPTYIQNLDQRRQLPQLEQQYEQYKQPVDSIEDLLADIPEDDDIGNDDDDDDDAAANIS